MKKRIYNLILLLFLSLSSNHIMAQCGSLPNDCDGDGIPNNLDLDNDNDGIPDELEGKVIRMVENFEDAPGSTTSGYDNFYFAFPPGTSDVQNYGGTVGYFNNAAAVPLTGQIPAFEGQAFSGMHSSGTYVQESIIIQMDPAERLLTGFTYNINFRAYQMNLGPTSGGVFNHYGYFMVYGIRVGQPTPAPPSNARAWQMANVGKVDLLGSSPLITNTTDWQNVNIITLTTAEYDRIVIIPTNTIVYGSSDGANMGAGTDCYLGFDALNYTLYRDSDGDGIPDFMDLDSDNDGCPDALEGSRNFTTADLDVNGRLIGGVDANGIPLIANPTQHIGTSIDPAVNACSPKSYNINEQIPGMPTLLNLGEIPFLGSDSTSGINEQEWTNRTIIITSVPTNGFILKYNGEEITTSLRIENYVPELLTIEPGPTTPIGTTTTQFEYSVEDSDGETSTPSTFKIEFEEPLPVMFGSIIAEIINNQLHVTWQTTSEVNNDHFVIEVSKDGKTFIALGKVASMAKDGNSDTPLEYSFSKGIEAALILPLAFLGLTWATRRRQLRNVIMLLLCGSIIYSIGCTKSDKNINSSQELYVRIKQVDKDGSFTYSKTVKTIIK